MLSRPGAFLNTLHSVQWPHQAVATWRTWLRRTKWLLFFSSLFHWNRIKLWRPVEPEEGPGRVHFPLLLTLFFLNSHSLIDMNQGQGFEFSSSSLSPTTSFVLPHVFTCIFSDFALCTETTFDFGLHSWQLISHLAAAELGVVEVG